MKLYILFNNFSLENCAQNMACFASNNVEFLTVNRQKLSPNFSLHIIEIIAKLTLNQRLYF